MPILCLLAAIVIAALMFAAVYAFSYGIAKVALKVLPESDPNEGLPTSCCVPANSRRSKIPGLPLLKMATTCVANTLSRFSKNATVPGQRQSIL